MWLLKPEVLQAMRAARELGYQPTLEERARFADQMRAAYAAARDEQPRNMQVAGDTAQISIDGVLTEKPDCIALIFGGGNTTYADIRKALALAENDPAVKRIVLDIASPGGHVNGLFETFAALDAVTKPISVRSSFAASAAYGLAAVAGPIEATTPAAEFGSIGVAASYWLDAEVVDIASTEAPKKRPDVATDEGKAMVREELDALHDLFASAIARGRAATTGEDINAATVNAEFGRGGMLVASSAKKRGMIDRIATQPKRTRGAKGAEHENPTVPEPAPTIDASVQVGGAHERDTTMTMTKDELQKNHPELYTAVLAEGTDKERKRVLAHLKLGESSGAMDVAKKAIADGSSTLEEGVHAEYMSAQFNRRDKETRQKESDDAGATVNNARKETKGDLVDVFAADLPPNK
jgi:ClpP class serine protease